MLYGIPSSQVLNSARACTTPTSQTNLITHSNSSNLQFICLRHEEDSCTKGIYQRSERNTRPPHYAETLDKNSSRSKISSQTFPTMEYSRTMNAGHEAQGCCKAQEKRHDPAQGEGRQISDAEGPTNLCVCVRKYEPDTFRVYLASLIYIQYKLPS